MSTFTRRSNQPTALLVGSPISYVRDREPPGVPLAQGIVQIAEQRALDEGLGAEFAQEVLSINSPAERYVSAMTFLGQWLEQEDVNQVILNAVGRARQTTGPLVDDGTPDDWLLTPASRAIGRLMVDCSSVFSGPVLTTNFDPLVGLSITEAGGAPSLCVLESDGSIPKQSLTGGVPVVHIHGYWRETDTLHTATQLTHPRPALEGSLRTLLASHRLLVVGCGGWDDIFLKALAQVAKEAETKCNVIWAFYESDPVKVLRSRYSTLFDAVGPLLTRNRFRPYGGIDCHEFLPELAQALAPSLAKPQTVSERLSAETRGDGLGKPKRDSSRPPPPSPEEDEVQTDESPQETLQQTLTRDFSGILDNTSVAADAHSKVRKFELDRAAAELDNRRALLVQTTWGVDVSAFIRAALVKSEVHGFSGVARVDVSECADTPAILSAVERDLGLPFQTLAASAADDKSFCLMLDGVDTWPQGLFDTAWGRIGKALLDYCGNASIVFVARGNLKWPTSATGLSVIHLGPLDQAEVREYVGAHPRRHAGVLASPQLLARLHEISGGITSQIDQLLATLEYMPALEVLGAEAQVPDVPRTDLAHTSALEGAISRLEASEEGQRALSALKVLAVLTYGVPFRVIRRFYQRKPCYQSQISRLKTQGLVEVTRRSVVYEDLADQTSVDVEMVLRCPAAVRTAVAQRLSSDERLEIVKRAASLLLGERWRQGQIKPQRLSSGSGGLGNEYIVVISLARRASDTGDAMELKRALRAGVALMNALNGQKRWADTIQLGRELLALVETEEDEAEDSVRASIYPHYVYALRMFGSREEAIEVGEQALETLSLGKESRRRIFHSLALAHKSLGDKDRSLMFARQARDLSTKGKSAYLSMDSLIIYQERKSGWLQDLIELEKRARRLKHTVPANNIAIWLSQEVAGDKKKQSYLRQPAMSYEDRWNQYRAAVSYVDNLLRNGHVTMVSRTDERTIIRAYSYYFAQHIQSSFSRAHRVLFRLWRDRGDNESVLMLSRHSSFFWRLHGMADEEEAHMVEISPVVQEVATSFSKKVAAVIRYCAARLKLFEGADDASN